jgi:hypothetical protein
MAMVCFSGLCLKSRIGVSTGSGSDLVKHGRQESLGYPTLLTDQVATAPCTD